MRPLESTTYQSHAWLDVTSMVSKNYQILFREKCALSINVVASGAAHSAMASAYCQFMNLSVVDNNQLFSPVFSDRKPTEFTVSF